MKRRNFFLAPLAALFPNVELKAEPKKVMSEFGLGEYVRHGTNSNEFMEPDGHRYATFPIQNKLTIRYQNGIEQYVCFNMTKEWHMKINTMSIHELMKYRKIQKYGEQWFNVFELDEDKPFLTLKLCQVEYNV